MVAGCRVIVFVVGELGGDSGLRWEVETIFRLGFERKTVFVLPPIRERVIRRRWNALVKLSSGRLPAYRGGELVATFGEDGLPKVYRS
jgi:hypothetical protein